MKLEKLVTTYEQSKRIQELGFTRESLFSYFDWTDGSFGGLGVTDGTDQPWLLDFGHSVTAQYATFTSEELGEILPTKIEERMKGINRNLSLSYFANYRLLFGKKEKSREYYVAYSNQDGDMHYSDGPTLAQAMGDMLIYLLENDLLPDYKKDE